MKNAMKKLTSLLLVALLLVGVMPFAAFANDDIIPGGSNGGSGSDTTNLLTTQDDDTIIPGARNIEPQNTNTGSSNGPSKTITYEINSDDGAFERSGNTQANVGEYYTTVLGRIATIPEKYSVSPDFVTVEDDTSMVTFTLTTKEYWVTVEINGFNNRAQIKQKHGTELPLSAELLRMYNLSLHEDYEIDYFSVAGDSFVVDGAKTITVYVKKAGTSSSNNGAGAGTGSNINTQIWADVVINPAKSDVNSTLVEGDYVRYYTTSDGYITPEQRDDLAQKIVGKNIIAWKLKDGRTSASIRDFKFTEPTNVYPVIGSTTNNNGSNNGSNSNNVEYTVTFVDHTGTKVLHTATTNTNGKLSRDDVELAGYRANNVDGYTFSNRWQVGTNANSTVSTDALVEMTFTANTTVSPRYTQNPVESDIVTSTKNQNDIFLNIFVNKDFNNCKTVKLNDHWVISDNKITTYEILNYVVTDYYKASNTNLGLQCDGLYYSVGSFMYNWLLDNAAVKTDAIDNIDVKRANGTVTINVMVTNAVAKTSTYVASDNPKTGDTIYTAMTVMGLSAASLAAVMYVFNKKRHTV